MKSDSFFTAQLDRSILDVVFPVSKGPSRISKKWTNTEMTWGKLAEQTAQTKRTPETMAEYMAMSRDQQAKIKDVGGVVCGLLKHDKTSADELAGRKTKENILSRSILTFDLDECPAGFSPEPLIREKLPGVAAIGYTTHKHTPQAPRWRVFIPLSEWVSPFYYEAIARYVGSVLGMQLMDKTTFQYNRLMYWPSTAKDGEFLHFALEGLPISPMELVKAHPELKRESTWPRHPDEEQLKPQSIMTEKEGVYNNVEKPQASIQKPGVIGAFCQCYTISQAIATFLSDVYKPEGHNRYTYIPGSTSKGLVIFDADQHAFSNHATDPANNGHLVNAFDLVRIHKFGALDVGLGKGYKGNNTPSFNAMCDFALADEKVNKVLHQKALRGAKDDFQNVTDDNDDGWKDGLEMARSGKYKNTKVNQHLIMLNDRVFRTIRYNDFSRSFEVGNTLALNCDTGVNDTALENISLRYEKEYGIKVSQDTVMNVLKGRRKDISYNPLHSFIRKVEWDGVKRIDTIFIHYLGAEDTPLNRAMTRKWMIAAVTRAFCPGAKFDEMLILEGPQGIGKSLILRTLANGQTMGGDFFNESLAFDQKDAELIENMNRAWIAEFAELSGLKSVKDSERVKAFISKQEDTKRMAYAHTPETFKRHTVFAGTTNESTFLADTSARKFWILHVNGNARPVREWIQEVVDNVHLFWAEAYQAYMEHESLELPDQLKDAAREMQRSYNTANDDPAAGIIKAYLDFRLPMDWRKKSRDARANFIRTYNQAEEEMSGCLIRNKISVAEIKHEVEDVKGYGAIYIRRIMETLQWERFEGEKKQIDPIYGQQKIVFFRPGTDGKDTIDDSGSSEGNLPFARLAADDDDEDNL